jgi:hypothetical protein
VENFGSIIIKPQKLQKILTNQNCKPERKKGAESRQFSTDQTNKCSLFHFASTHFSYKKLLSPSIFYCKKYIYDNNFIMGGVVNSI